MTVQVLPITPCMKETAKKTMTVLAIFLENDSFFK